MWRLRFYGSYDLWYPPGTALSACFFIPWEQLLFATTLWQLNSITIELSQFFRNTVRLSMDFLCETVAFGNTCFACMPIIHVFVLSIFTTLLLRWHQRSRRTLRNPSYSSRCAASPHLKNLFHPCPFFDYKFSPEQHSLKYWGSKLNIASTSWIDCINQGHGVRTSE